MKKSHIYVLIISFFIVSGCIRTQTPSLATPKPEQEAKPAISYTATPTQISESILKLPQPLPSQVVYDFIDHMCDAQWSNNGVALACPSENTDGNMGAVLRQPIVLIENSVLVEQPALLTLPAQKGSGYGGIFGIFPAIEVKNGDRFRAVLACSNQMQHCDLTFSLEYFQTENIVKSVPGAIWVKTFSPAGDTIVADVDLSSLAGRKIRFILTVRDNGDPNEDWGVWLQPHIWRMN